MSISRTLQEFLKGEGVDYELVPHKHTYTSASTAEAAHVPGEGLAKAIMLEDDKGYLMAVIPSTHRLQLGVLHNTLNRRLGLATESELMDLFPDCEVGAIPPLGEAFGVDTVVEDSLFAQSDIWFEAGDHRDVVHISGPQFKTLMMDARHGHISEHR